MVIQNNSFDVNLWMPTIHSEASASNTINKGTLHQFLTDCSIDCRISAISHRSFSRATQPVQSYHYRLLPYQIHLCNVCVTASTIVRIMQWHTCNGDYWLFVVIWPSKWCLWKFLLSMKDETSIQAAIVKMYVSVFSYDATDVLSLLSTP
jgi:hypothetical protein